MLRTILINISSGYLSKAIQFAVSIAILPFLLADTQLGLSGWGLVSSLLAVGALLSMLMDGWRLSIAKTIGEYIGGLISENLTSGIYLSSAVIAGVFSVLLWLNCDLILGAVGLAEINGIKALLILIVCQFLVEQTLYPSEVFLHASGLTWIVNGFVALEILGRSTILYLFFSAHGGSVVEYFEILLAFLAIRYLLMMFAALRAVPKMRFGRICFHNAMFGYSLPLSLKGAGNYLVFRSPILIANNYLGQEAAGVLGVLLINIRGYLHQALVGIVRPMIVPVASGISIAEMEPSWQRKMADMIDTYQLFTTSICLLLGTTASIWLVPWLGNGFSTLSLVVGLFVCIVGLETSVAVRNYLLIAQGHGAPLAYAGMLSAIGVVLLLLGLGETGRMNTHSTIYSISIQLVLYSGVFVSCYYKYAIERSRAGLGLPYVVSIVSAIIVAEIWLYNSPPPISHLTVVLASFSSLLVLFTSFHFMVMRIPCAISIIRIVVKALPWPSRS